MKNTWYLSVLTAMVCGCSASRPVETHAAIFSALGDDTRVSIDFASHPTAEVSHEFTREELCYMTFGQTMIVCQGDGSYVLFGRDDGMPLISDNPLYGLRVGNDNANGMTVTNVLGTLFLVAGSCERYPGALSDYLDDDNRFNRSAALSAARVMLKQKGAVFVGAARGGTFSVRIDLTEAGMDKLREALASHEKLEGIHLVRYLSRNSSGHHASRVLPLP